MTKAQSAWLEERRSYLGGTDIAALAGMNPYKTPLKVYLDKTGQVEDTAGIKARMGTALEPLVKELFTDETGLKIKKPPQHVRHHIYPFLGGNPDGLIGKQDVLECKTFDYTTEEEWGEPGTDKVPRAYFVQATWYCGLLGRKRCYMAALHRTTGKFGVYVLRFDPELFRMLVKVGVDFRRNYWEPGIEPVPEAGDLEIIRNRYPTDDGEFMIADRRMDEFAERMAEIAAIIAPLQGEYDDLKTKFIERVGSASLIETMSGQFTFRQPKNGRVSWKKLALALDPPREVIAAHTKPASRRFITPWGGDKED